VQGSDDLIGRGREDPLLAGRVFPVLPKPCECKRTPIADCDGIRLLGLAVGLPLVKGFGGHEAAAGLVRGPEGQGGLHGLPARIDALARHVGGP
jgi:hypothetical protein